MACNCLEGVNAMLAEHNTRIMIPITFNPDVQDRPMVVTEQIERGRGKAKAKGMFATFCPFCGCRYVTEPCKPAAECGDELGPCFGRDK